MAPFGTHILSRAVVLGALVTLAAQGVAQVPTPRSAITQPMPFTETQWMQSFMAEDAARLAVLMEGSTVVPDVTVTVTETPASAEAPSYEIVVMVDGKETRFRRDSVAVFWDPAWSAEALRTLSPALAAAESSAKDARPNADLSEKVLLRVGAFGPMSDLIAQDKRLSEELKKAPLDGSLHAQAALLLGLVALAESAPTLGDTRPHICRMATHLAAARILAPNDTNCLPVAEAMHLALQGRQADALRQIDAMLAANPKLGDWAAGLRMYVTDDYRTMKGEGANSFQRLMHLRAVSRTIGSGRAIEEASAGSFDELRALRIIGTGNASVASVQQVAEPWIMAEEAFCKEVIAAFGLQGQGLAALNVEPRTLANGTAGGEVAVEVVGPGIWGLHAQRQLAEAAMHGVRGYRDMWGVPEAAMELAGHVDELQKGTWMRDFALLETAPDESTRGPAVQRAMQAFGERRHIVPMGAFQLTSAAPWYQRGQDRRIMAPYFRISPPPGSAFDMENRLRTLNPAGFPSLAEKLNALAQRAPYNGMLAAYALYNQHGDTVPKEAVLAAVEPFRGYNAEAMLWVARGADPATQAEVLILAGEIDPKYWIMGDLQHVIGTERMVEYAEKARAAEAEAIPLSNIAPKLVRHYIAKKELEKAKPWAELGGWVGSSRGYEASGLYLEATGDYVSALATYMDAEERYGGHLMILGFLGRNEEALRAQGLGAQLDGIRKSVIATLRPVGDMAFSGPPAQGVYVEKSTPHTDAAGLQKGDVIVAVNGYLVASYPEFAPARDVNAPAPFALKVWREGEYLDITADPPFRMFDIDLPPYRAR